MSTPIFLVLALNNSSFTPFFANPKSAIQNPKSRSRYRKKELADFSHSALPPNLAAVHLDELFRQRKPQAGALRFSRLTGCLLKFKKDPFMIFWCDPRPCVTHLDAHGAVFGVRADPNSTPFRRKLDGVSDQIQEHLLDSSTVHGKWFRQSSALDVKVDCFLYRQRTHRILHRLEDVAQQRRLDLQFHLSGLDLRQIKDFIDQAK